mmetsp:Transcript_112339/g.322962  ORF Transcript_112339/g.322962 Transcript_112339/m.322962 type:complete len:274 (-) Transcript_112339:629-1450(-)
MHGGLRRPRRGCGRGARRGPRGGPAASTEPDRRLCGRYLARQAARRRHGGGFAPGAKGCAPSPPAAQEPLQGGGLHAGAKGGLRGLAWRGAPGAPSVDEPGGNSGHCAHPEQQPLRQRKRPAGRHVRWEHVRTLLRGELLRRRHMARAPQRAPARVPGLARHRPRRGALHRLRPVARRLPPCSRPRRAPLRLGFHMQLPTLHRAAGGDSLLHVPRLRVAGTLPQPASTAVAAAAHRSAGAVGGPGARGDGLPGLRPGRGARVCGALRGGGSRT